MITDLSTRASLMRKSCNVTQALEKDFKGKTAVNITIYSKYIAWNFSLFNEILDYMETLCKLWANWNAS